MFPIRFERLGKKKKISDRVASYLVEIRNIYLLSELKSYLLIYLTHLSKGIRNQIVSENA